MKFSESKIEYSVKTCPMEDTQMLENLLNTMAEEGWDLYALQEAENEEAELQYNAIFQREYREVHVEETDVVDVKDFRTRMEKMLQPSEEPYEQCKEIQDKIKQKLEKIEQIKKSIDLGPNESDRERLNKEMSENLVALDGLKAQLTLIVDPDNMKERIEQDKLVISLSDELLDLVNSSGKDSLIAETVKLRQELTDKYGYIIPAIKFKDSDRLDENEYKIYIRGIKAFSGYVYPDCRRFELGQAGIDKKPKNSIEDIDSITGNKAFWVKEDVTKNYWEKGDSAADVIVNNLKYVIFRYLDEVFDYNDANLYLDIIAEKNLYLVENIIPDCFSVGEIRSILVQLLKEKVSLKDIVYVFEKINDFADDKEEILQNVRVGLKRQICHDLKDNNDTIYLIKLSERLEEKLTAYIENEDKVALDKIIAIISKAVYNSDVAIENIAIIVPKYIRLEVFKSINLICPDVAVLSEEELVEEFNKEVLEVIE